MSTPPLETAVRHCFRDPIPELFDVAKYLDAAVSAHWTGHHEVAKSLLSLANCPVSRAWVDSIWGAKSPYVRLVASPAPPLAEEARGRERMPSKALKAALHKRDGFHCRYCGLPVIRADIRKAFVKLYPDVVTWGSTNASQHAGFQSLWAQYDHVVPHSYGGTNDLENLVVSCGACNFGKMNFRLEDLGLSDPRARPPVVSTWDGLERFMRGSPMAVQGRLLL